jgi:hypothetical protein
MRSLELSRRQGAPAWELRTAIDVAILLEGRGRSDSARTLLQPAFDKFADGSDMAEPKAARRLLARLDPLACPATPSPAKPVHRLPIGLYSRAGEPV